MMIKKQTIMMILTQVCGDGYDITDGYSNRVIGEERDEGSKIDNARQDLRQQQQHMLGLAFEWEYEPHHAG